MAIRSCQGLQLYGFSSTHHRYSAKYYVSLKSVEKRIPSSELLWFRFHVNWILNRMEKRADCTGKVKSAKNLIQTWAKSQTDPLKHTHTHISFICLPKTTSQISRTVPELWFTFQKCSYSTIIHVYSLSGNNKKHILTLKLGYDLDNLSHSCYIQPSRNKVNKKEQLKKSKYNPLQKMYAKLRTPAVSKPLGFFLANNWTSTRCSKGRGGIEEEW